MIEQELRDVVQDTSENTSLLKKDTVFAHMNFKLESGVFKLLTDQTPSSAGGPSGNQKFKLLTDQTPSSAGEPSGNQKSPFDLINSA